MLTTLFSALYPRPAPAPARAEEDFAPTAVLESPACALDTGGRRGPDAPSRDVIVRGTTSDVIRRQLLPPADERAMRRITLFDPCRQMARHMVRLLADVSGEPLERIYLRRQDTLSTLSLVERTSLPRRIAEPLQIAHAEVRSPSLRAASVPLALLGHSHLAVVVLAPMAPAVLDELLALLHEAVRRPDWACPNLLFLSGAPDPQAMARVKGVQWPAHVNVEIGAEAVGTASAAWNAVLRGWNRLKLLPQRVTPALPASAPGPLPPGIWSKAHADARRRTNAAALLGRGFPPVREPASRSRLDPVTMRQALEALAGVRGVLGAALADSTTGLVLGRRVALREGIPDLDEAALTLSEVLKAHRRATLDRNRSQGIEEVLVTQPRAHQVLRTLAVQPQLFLFVVLDRLDGNLTLARHAVARAEKILA